ncbi:MAG: hypothetical protein AAF266_07250, partial [Planctomycetota bacterium]
MATPPPATTPGASPLESILSPDLAAALAKRSAIGDTVAAPTIAVADRPTVATPPKPPADAAYPPPPPEPGSIIDAGLGEGLVDALLLKVLLHNVT